MRSSAFSSVMSILPLALLTLALLATLSPVQAQSQATIQSCSASLSEPTYQETYTLDGTDTSAWTFVYTWDYAYCGSVPVAGVWLYDVVSGARYTCTYTQFTSANTMTSVCKMTKAGMVASGDTDWYMYMKYGVKPTYYSREDDFNIQVLPVSSTSTSMTTSTTSTTSTVATITTATSSGAALKRRRSEQTGLAIPSGFGCPDRQRACPAGRKGIWKCVDILTDLNACGGCPHTESSQDCGDIAGAGHVQCIMGSCVVNSCDRYHHLSQNGTACLHT